jgi:hypothetical protein
MPKLNAKEYFETSAKDGVNVNAGFQLLSRILFSRSNIHPSRA